jgi:hypothetical protein
MFEFTIEACVLSSNHAWRESSETADVSHNQSRTAVHPVQVIVKVIVMISFRSCIRRKMLASSVGIAATGIVAVFVEPVCGLQWCERIHSDKSSEKPP